ncbi:hypothetical protein V8G54_011860 [Vigna mungo]|uniref:Uncharacterized protein n=1 Tax=Vigna mungo TaxID=3915 RepID=A0AAQ3NQ58_VIGMU
MRLKCVSKKLHSLINNLYFLKLHKKRSSRLKLNLRSEVKIYTKMGETHHTLLCYFLESRNYAAAYKESYSYDKCLKAIAKGSTFNRRSRDSVYACLSRPSPLLCRRCARFRSQS